MDTLIDALQRELSQLATAVNLYDKMKQPYNKGELVDAMVARLRPHLLDASVEEMVHCVICLAYHPNPGAAVAVAAIKKARGTT